MQTRGHLGVVFNRMYYTKGWIHKRVKAIEFISCWKDLDMIGGLIVDEIAELCKIKSHQGAKIQGIPDYQIIISILA